ncbi:MAG TPA: UbiX family flavin prenyltransferase [Thermoplasmatales archaeon]|nr:UbiX family flavin prenyltransferase [Thermoplasmatales archaeon]
MKIVVGICGASGVIYGIKLVKILHQLKKEVHLIISDAAKKIMEHETDIDLDTLKNLATKTYENDDFFSAPASGSFQVDAMVVIPCSLKTLSAIANGYTDTLISRAAICCLKESKPLILVPRETPLDLSTLKNMVKAKESGAIILPAMPAFYHKPSSIEDMIDFIVGKILDQLGIEHNLFKRWG